MALELRTRTVSFTFRDNNRKTGTAEVSFRTTATPADVVGAIPTLVPLLAALTNAAIVRAAANFSYVETEPGSPTPPSEIERRLLLTGRAANGGVVRFSIPSASFNLETSGTNEVSLDSPPVSAFVNWVTANAGSIVGSPVTSIERAVIIHRYRVP